MVFIILAGLGLIFGSFINALVWRLHEQSKKSKNKSKELSIMHGRSMCPRCRHELSASDLIPVFSWLALNGKCRYCHQPISWQYPIVEALTAFLFVFSYIAWPLTFDGRGTVLFVFWLFFLVGLIALAVFDIRWYILPDKIVFPLFWLAIGQVVVLSLAFNSSFEPIKAAFWGLVVGGGIFYVLFQISGGRWIGGGDVKLGGLLGLIVGGPALSFLMLFLASVLGTVVAVPLLATHKLKPNSRLPFGPFLIMAAIIVRLFGVSLISWYKRQLIF